MPRAPHPKVVEHLADIARTIAEDAPDGWTRAHIGMGTDSGGSVFGSGAWIDLADGGHAPGGEQPHELATAIRALDDTDGEELIVEVSVEPGGRFEGLTSRAITGRHDSDGNEVRYLYVRDASVRPPDLGDLQPGPENPAEAGDPEEAVRLLQRYLELVGPILGWEEGRPLSDLLPESAGEDLIAEMEQEAGIRLPADLRALYLLADGDETHPGPAIFDRHPWRDIVSLADLHREAPWWDAPGDTWKYHEFGVVRSDGLAKAAARSSVSRPGWIVFADSTGGDFLAVDMDPALGGRPGQVIKVGLNYDAGPLVVADSVTSLLRLQVEALERGDYQSHDGRDVHIGAGLPSYLEPMTTGEENGESGRVSVRHATVSSAAEMNALDGDEGVLAVTVRSDEPVSLRPLLGSPLLYGLELFDAADVRDMGLIAELPGLRFLAMRFDQWRRLVDVLGGPPPGAAAILTGTPGLGQLAEWAGMLGGADDVHHVSGDLTSSTVDGTVRLPGNGSVIAATPAGGLPILCRVHPTRRFHMSKFARPAAPDPYTLLPDAPSFTLTSEDLEDGKAMPLAHVHVRPGGENISPQLSWSGAPEGTKSYVVTCFDPDAPTVSGFWHWIVAGIPAEATGLARDAGAEGGANLPAGALHLRNDFGDNAYGGAAPPEGDGPHRYMFVVHALSASAEEMEWEEGDPAGYASFATTDTTLARARLTVTYER